MDVSKAFQQKTKNIAKFVDKKDESIRLSSIRRDAALFTAARLGGFKQASQADFITELTYWIAYFSTEIYKSSEQLNTELAKKMREAEKKEPLNSL